MTRDELLEKLRSMKDSDGDPELDHSDADLAIIEYINDPEIEEAYRAIPKWYA